MGANPQQQALSSAQSSIEEAVRSGEKLAKNLRKRGGKYRDRAGNIQKDIKKYLGREQKPSSYYSRISENFGAMPSMPEQIKTYQAQLNQGDYPILGSPAHQRFEDTLMRTANAFDEYTQRGLNEIQPRFAAIAKDPSFNLQYDPKAMQMAQGNINEGQVKRLTRYSV